jgi:putative flippase GtrA
MRAGFWFFGVAAAAGLTHLAVFFGINWFFPSVMPELANFLAFCVAFSVSFAGHRNLSFSDTTSSVKQSLRRFIGVSVAGFVCNEIVFSLLIRQLDWPYWLALPAGFAVAGAQTYLLSRYWAFHRK